MARNILRLILALCTLAPVAATAQGLSQEFGEDRRGNDYSRFQVRNLDECQRSCRRDARCLAYTFIRSTRACYLKDRVNLPQRNADAVTGTKSGVPIRPPVDQVTQEEGVDRRGDDYTSFQAPNVDRCKQACSRDVRCRAYTYFYTNRTCYLKERAPRPSSSRQAVSGVKTGGGLPGGGLLTEEPGRDRKGNDYTSFRVRGFGECKRSCARDRRCRAYTFIYSTGVCYLKDRANPAKASSDAVTGFKQE